MKQRGTISMTIQQCDLLLLWVRAVFKWLSKAITWLRLLRLVIGLKDSHQFFNQWESKPIAPCTRDFSRASSELQVIARNCDWFIGLPAPVIGRSHCFGFGFSTVIWKPLYNFWINDILEVDVKRKTQHKTQFAKVNFQTTSIALLFNAIILPN